MPFKLRPYQEEAVEASVKYLFGKSRKPGVVVMPTGSGKSLVLGSVAKRLDAPTLVLQPSKEILMQNYGKAVSFGLNPTIYSASCGEKELSKLTYATLGSVKKEIENLKQLGIKYLLCDEAHFKYSPDPESEFMKFISNFPEAKVLGFTATPCRLHSYQSLTEGNYSKLNMLTKDIPRFFENMVHVVQVGALLEQGFWSKMRYEVWRFDESDLVLNSTGAEYTEDSVRASIEKNGVNNTIYRRLLMLLEERKHILVCMDSVGNAHRISEFMNGRMGYITDVVEGGTPKKKRERILDDFKTGKVRIVFNHSTLTTGFDFPELDCVIFGRPTFSYSTYYQVIGRGVRPHKDKAECLFIDCCNNYRRFGRVEDLSIENFPRRGWTMFSGDKVISNIPMDETLTRQDLLEKYGMVPGRAKEENPAGEFVFPVGMHEGKKLKDIPLSYLKWFAEEAKDSKYYDKVEEYLLSL